MSEVVVLQKTVNVVKGIVDELYALTSTGPYYGGFSGSPSRYRHIITILVRRGALVRSGHANKPVYSWNPHAMPPTKVFYENVAKDMVLAEREYARKNYEKKGLSTQKHTDMSTTTEHVQTPDEKPQIVSLSSFSDKELLDELKSRGWSIGNGELVRCESLK